jgi:hypothetical protein
MTEPDRLPNLEEAVISRERLEGYCLNPAHGRGANKARVFSSTLGIESSDWLYLKAQIEEGIKWAGVYKVKETKWGKQYGIRVPVEGLNGKSAVVQTGWQIDAGSTIPRMTSAYVDRKGRPRDSSQ